MSLVEKGELVEATAVGNFERNADLGIQISAVRMDSTFFIHGSWVGIGDGRWINGSTRFDFSVHQIPNQIFCPCMIRDVHSIGKVEPIQLKL